MNTKLAFIVVQPFREHKHGAVISDPDAMKALEGTEEMHRVVRSSVPVSDVQTADAPPDHAE